MKTFLTILIAVIVILVLVAIYMARIKPKNDNYQSAGNDESQNVILQPDGIQGTQPCCPGTFAVYFSSGNRPPNGQTYKALKKVKVTEAGKFNGTYNTIPGNFFIDGNGNLGNIILKGNILGDFKKPVKIELL